MQFLSLTQAAKLIPTCSGRPPGHATIWRWVRHGYRAPDGQIIRLKSLRFGSRICVTEQALLEFAEALSAAHETPTPATKTATPTRRKRRATSNDDPERQAAIEAATARVLARRGGGA